MLAWRPPVDPDPTEPRPSGLPPFATNARRPNLARELPVLVVIAAVIAFVIRTFVGQFFYIPSPSMGCEGCPVHTLHVDDKILVSKLSYRLHDPRRGDVVVFECPPGAGCENGTGPSNPLLAAPRWVLEHLGVVQPSTEDYIKRIVALPGETVEAHGGAVYVDGRALDEPYLPASVVTSDFGPVTVPAGRYWVMGDNRPNSSDSRSFGPIEADTIIGRTVMKVWPPLRAGHL